MTSVGFKGGDAKLVRIILCDVTGMSKPRSSSFAGDKRVVIAELT